MNIPLNFFFLLGACCQSTDGARGQWRDGNCRGRRRPDSTWRQRWRSDLIKREHRHKLCKYSIHLKKLWALEGYVQVNRLLSFSIYFISVYISVTWRFRRLPTTEEVSLYVEEQDEKCQELHTKVLNSYKCFFSITCYPHDSQLLHVIFFLYFIIVA